MVEKIRMMNVNKVDIKLKFFILDLKLKLRVCLNFQIKDLKTIIFFIVKPIFFFFFVKNNY